MATIPTSTDLSSLKKVQAPICLQIIQLNIIRLPAYWAFQKSYAEVLEYRKKSGICQFKGFFSVYSLIEISELVKTEHFLEKHAYRYVM